MSTCHFFIKLSSLPRINVLSHPTLITTQLLFKPLPQVNYQLFQELPLLPLPFTSHSSLLTSTQTTTNHHLFTLFHPPPPPPPGTINIISRTTSITITTILTITNHHLFTFHSPPSLVTVSTIPRLLSYSPDHLPFRARCDGNIP